jgi:hypothetical protein
LDEAPYKLSGAVAKLMGITFRRLAFSYWIDNLGFITEGKLAAIFIKPSLGVSNWPVDEGMTNGSPTFAYLVFGLGGVSFERFSRPTKASARRGPGATLGVQAKLRGVQVGLVFVYVLFLNRSDLYLA